MNKPRVVETPLQHLVQRALAQVNRALAIDKQLSRRERALRRLLTVANRLPAEEPRALQKFRVEDRRLLALLGSVTKTKVSL